MYQSCLFMFAAVQSLHCIHRAVYCLHSSAFFSSLLSCCTYSRSIYLCYTCYFTTLIEKKRGRRLLCNACIKRECCHTRMKGNNTCYWQYLFLSCYINILYGVMCGTKRWTPLQCLWLPSAVAFEDLPVIPYFDTTYLWNYAWDDMLTEWLALSAHSQKASRSASGFCEEYACCPCVCEFSSGTLFSSHCPKTCIYMSDRDSKLPPRY